MKFSSYFQSILFLGMIISVVYSQNLPSIARAMNDVYVTNYDYIIFGLDDYFSGDDLQFTLSVTPNDTNVLSLIQRTTLLTQQNMDQGTFGNWTASALHTLSNGDWSGRIIFLAANSFYFMILDNTTTQPTLKYQFSVSLPANGNCFDTIFIEIDIAYILCVDNIKQKTIIYIMDLEAQNFTYISQSWVNAYPSYSYSNYHMRRDAYGSLKNALYLYQSYLGAANQYEGLGFIEVWNISNIYNPTRFTRLINSKYIGCQTLNILDVQVVNDYLYIADGIAAIVYRLQFVAPNSIITAVFTHSPIYNFTSFNIYSHYYGCDTTISLVYGSQSVIQEYDWTNPKYTILNNVYTQLENKIVYVTHIQVSSYYIYIVDTLSYNSNFIAQWFVIERDNLIDIYTEMVINREATQQNGGFFFLTYSSIISQGDDIIIYGNSPSYTMLNVSECRLETQNFAVPASYDVIITALANNYSVQNNFTLIVRVQSNNTIELINNDLITISTSLLPVAEILYVFDTQSIVGNNLSYLASENSLGFVPLVSHINSSYFTINTESIAEGWQVLETFFISTSTFSLENSCYYFIITTNNEQNESNINKMQLNYYDCGVSNTNISCSIVGDEPIVLSGDFIQIVAMSNMFGILTLNTVTDEYIYRFFSYSNSFSTISLFSDSSADEVEGCTNYYPQPLNVEYLVCVYPASRKVLFRFYNSYTTHFDSVFEINENTLGDQNFFPQDVIWAENYNEIIFIKNLTSLLAVKVDFKSNISAVVGIIEDSIMIEDPNYEVSLFENAILIWSKKLSIIHEYNTKSMRYIYLNSIYPTAEMGLNLSNSNIISTQFSNNLFYVMSTNNDMLTIITFRVGQRSVNDVFTTIDTSINFVNINYYSLSTISIQNFDILVMFNTLNNFGSRFEMNLISLNLIGACAIGNASSGINEIVENSIEINIIDVNDKNNSYNYTRLVGVYNPFVAIQSNIENFSLDVNDGENYFDIANLSLFPNSSILNYSIYIDSSQYLKKKGEYLNESIQLINSFILLNNDSGLAFHTKSLYYDVDTSYIFRQTCTSLEVNKTLNYKEINIIPMANCSFVTYSSIYDLSVSVCFNPSGSTSLIFSSISDLVISLNTTVPISGVTEIQFIGNFLFILGSITLEKAIFIYSYNQLANEISFLSLINSATIQASLDIVDFDVQMINNSTYYYLTLLDFGYGARILSLELNNSSMKINDIYNITFYNSSSNSYLNFTSDVVLNSFDCANDENSLNSSTVDYTCILTTINSNHFLIGIKLPYPDSKEGNAEFFIKKIFQGYGGYCVVGNPAYSQNYLVLGYTNYINHNYLVIYQLNSTNYNVFISNGYLIEFFNSNNMLFILDTEYNDDYEFDYLYVDINYDLVGEDVSLETIIDKYVFGLVQPYLQISNNHTIHKPEISIIGENSYYSSNKLIEINSIAVVSWRKQVIYIVVPFSVAAILCLIAYGIFKFRERKSKNSLKNSEDNISIPIVGSEEN